jgi:hypothetical protein
MIIVRGDALASKVLPEGSIEEYEAVFCSQLQLNGEWLLVSQSNLHILHHLGLLQAY